MIDAEVQPAFGPLNRGGCCLFTDVVMCTRLARSQRSGHLLSCPRLSSFGLVQPLTGSRSLCLAPLRPVALYPLFPRARSLRSKATRSITVGSAGATVGLRGLLGGMGDSDRVAQRTLPSSRQTNRGALTKIASNDFINFNASVSRQQRIGENLTALFRFEG